MHADTDSQKLKVDQKFVGWTWPRKGVASLSWNSKIDCISKLNRWNKLIFFHAVTNSGKLKVDSIILGGPCQKWQWLFS